MIRLHELRKIFGAGDRAVVALKDVSLSVAAGQIFGVIGTSGAGKSTLIRCVNLLERPTSGHVWVNGRELTALSKAELADARREIGMIFQHSNLLNSRNVFGNIALPLELIGTPRNEIRPRVNELLDLVGLTDKREAYPAQLSGGQRQRVTIARALATKPKVLLSDEATSALDPATSRSILDLLRNINRQLNLTILLITHEMEVVKSICDQVAILGDGRLIEQGSVHEVFAHPQTSLARKFIRSTLQVDVPEDYRTRLSQFPGPNRNPLLRLELTGRSVSTPLISRLARLYNVEVGILSSRTDYAGGAKFGVLLVELFGEDSALRQAEAFLRENQVNVEVLGYVTSDDATVD